MYSTTFMECGNFSLTRAQMFFSELGQVITPCPHHDARLFSVTLTLQLGNQSVAVKRS